MCDGYDVKEDGTMYSEALYLKKYLMEKIPEILTQFREKRLKMDDCNEVGEVSMEISEIQFAYNNHKLIKLLKTRGIAIRDLNFIASPNPSLIQKVMKKPTVKETNEQIQRMIKDPKQKEDFTRPVCAFITFKKDDAIHEALEYSKKKW